MKKLVLIVCLFCLCVLQVSAHMLTADHDIGAIIHLDPDDDPIAGTPTSIYFDVKDKTGKFAPEKCDCLVSIKKDDSILTTFPLYGQGNSVDLEHAAAEFTFPQKGIYTVSLTGTPKSDGGFSAFTLAYDVRVERTVSGSSTTTVAPDRGFLFVALGLIIVGIAYIALQRKRA